jgi:hypothetical protein
MSEASYLVELREAAPPAPDRLREVVRALPTTEPRRSVGFRPALAAAAAIAVAVGLGAAVVGGVTSTKGQQSAGSSSEAARALQPHSAQTNTPDWKAYDSTRVPGAATLAPSLTAKSRLQRQDVSMSLRVKDLSAATQRAVGTTRRLGGFVAAADYSTDRNAGNSRLVVRVPVANLQKAIASFTQLGTILAQHISVTDLQGGVDRLDKRIATARRAGDDNKAKQLLRRRAALVREGTYAKVSLQLTTTKPAAQPAVPSRFDRFWDNTQDILGKELIAVLYALVVAGPFILLAALLFLGERARRRRADHRLLEETG